MKKYNLSCVDLSLKDNVYKACSRMRLKIDDVEGIKVNIFQGESAYLEIKPDEVEISYVKKYQIFYALKIMAVNDRKRSFRKEISCSFEHMGVMMDCSRNAVPNVEFLKSYILNLAIMGYNELQLYTEDTYEVEGEPLFGYMRGRYSVAELQEIVAFAAQFDMEVVPCIQTLAHLNQMFRWQKYREVNDIDDILLVGEEKTYQLIEKMFSTLEKAFTCRRVHIGMDEAHNVGRGRYLDINGHKKPTEVMIDHLKKVVEIAEKHGFEPMMWSDMFLRLINNGKYRVGADMPSIPTEIVENVPKAVKLVYWDYYADTKKDYDDMFDRHAEFKDNEITFAGGAWRWVGFVPMNKVSCDRTKLALESAKEHGIRDVLLTLWGDDGAECSWNAVLPTMSCAADIAYGEEDHDSNFVALTGLGFEDYCALDLPGLSKNACGNKVALYNDCFMGFFDPMISYEDQARYKEAESKLKKLARVPSPYSYVFDTEAKLCAVLANKATLGKRTRELYTKLKTGDEHAVVQIKKELKKLIKKRYKVLIKQLEVFYDAFKTQWYRENKPMGFEIQDVRLGGLMQRVRHCCDDLEKLLKGALIALPELDESQLGADVTRLDPHQNNYSSTISVNKLGW